MLGENGVTVTIDGQPTDAHLLDSTSISFIVPTISARKVAITVTNPGGGTYTLSASYDTSVRNQEPTPVLNNFSFFGTVPPSVGALATLTLTGSGFVADSQILLDGLPVQTEYMSSDQIVAYVYKFQTAGPHAIAVANPTGGTSNPLYVSVLGPTIAPGGVQNAAISATSVTLAAGGLATVYGTELGKGPASAQSPYPTTLEGVSVEVNGLSAPLLYVSPSQIDFVVPWEVAGAAQATVLVKINGVASNSVTVSLAPAAPGIFTLNGTGQGAVLIAGGKSVAAPTGMFTSSRPAKKGEFIEIFAAGLGAVSPQPPDGQAAKEPATTITTPSVFIGCTNSSTGLCQAPVQFSGLAPGFVGIYTVNVAIPASASSGNTIPLQMMLGQQASNTVNIAVE